MINKQTNHNEIHDDRCGDIAITQPDAAQTFLAAVILGDCLQDNAPPEISVDQEIPFLPTGIDGVAPILGIEQCKDFAKQSVTVLAIIAPINSASSVTPEPGLSRQLLVARDYRPGSAFEMQPGKITRPAANKWLSESEKHHEQSRCDGVEARLDSGAYHIGKCDAKCAAEHEVGHDAQWREENSQAKEEKGQGEPFNTAKISCDVRLGRWINRLEKAVGENAVIDNGSSNEPTETRSAVDLSTPLGGSGWSEKDQVFESQE